MLIFLNNFVAIIRVCLRLNNTNQNLLFENHYLFSLFGSPQVCIIWFYIITLCPVVL